SRRSVRAPRDDESHSRRPMTAVDFEPGRASLRQRVTLLTQGSVHRSNHAEDLVILNSKLDFAANERELEMLRTFLLNQFVRPSLVCVAAERLGQLGQRLALHQMI